MIEKVNPSHPDKVADRIAGALVDYAYTQQENPKIAIEVLIGHKELNIIAETSVNIPLEVIEKITKRIVGKLHINYNQVDQNILLKENQNKEIKTGDNGIFIGFPIDEEVKTLSQISKKLYRHFPTDGKYILNQKSKKLIICQSNANEKQLNKVLPKDYELIINPLGYWFGGINVDTGATNRKLGSDMGRAVSGGGLHGKDLSKADVSLNIYAHLLAQKYNKKIELYCHIGQDKINNIPYSQIVQKAKDYINNIGGFEKFAEWGLI